MNKKDLTIEFSAEILWLRRYYHNQIKQMIAERKKELRYPYKETDKNAEIKSTKPVTPQALKIIEIEEGDDELKKLTMWQDAISEYVQHTDENLLKAIKAVFVHKSMNISGAGRKYMYYSKTTTYKLFYEWLKGLSHAFVRQK